MLVIPAMNLRDHHCVHLMGGDRSEESVRFDDPVVVARRWATAGFTRLQVVDLDAAAGQGDNRDVVRDLLRQVTLPIQVGGGVQDDDALASLLDDGADQVITGTRGIEDPCWLFEQADRAPGRLILAADVRDRVVVSSGWTARTAMRLADLIAEQHGAPLAGLLVTAVLKDGRMEGADLPLIEEAVLTSPWPVIASGDVGSMQDLRNLEDRGVSAVVLGMGLFTEALDARVVAEEFAA